MAKKKVETKAPAASLSVEESLKTLYKLQTIASEIDRIQKLRGELPLEKEELEDRIEGLRARQANLSAEIEKLEAFIAERNLLIEQSKEKLERYTKQIEDVRNNREYMSLSKEIEYETLEIEYCEKKIREDQASIELHNANASELAAAIAEKEQELHVKAQELDAVIANTQEDEDRLEQQAHTIRELLEPRWVKVFDRLRLANSRNNGLAVAPIDRGACSGCYNNVPLQVSNELMAVDKVQNKVIVCDYCGRILVGLPIIEAVKAEEEAAAKKRKK